MKKQEYLAEAHLEGQKALEEWYSKQPENCSCKAILRQSGGWLNRDLIFSPERGRSQGCPIHCDHEGISFGGLCYCGERR